MQLPQRLARFNRHVTNPVQRLWAGWLPGFGILEHVGRRSGKPYRTPLNVFSAEVNGQPGVAILLTYGPDRDWLKNLNAAGGGRIRRNCSARCPAFSITRTSPLPSFSAWAARPIRSAIIWEAAPRRRVAV